MPLQLARRGCAGVLVADGERSDAQALGAAARLAGIRLLGPDSIGLVAPRLRLNASFAPFVPEAGGVALVAQSSSIAAGVLAWAARREVGFSGAVTLGAAADVDLADCLDHFGQDGRTRAILLALDEVEDAARFLSSARAAARLKPVLVLKPWQPAGETGGLTHAGLIVTPDRAHDAAFHRAGLLRVNDLDELFAAAETLGRMRQLVGGRLAIVSNGAGLAALAAGRLRQLGGSPKPLAMAAAASAVLALMPGLPALPFLVLGGLAQQLAAVFPGGGAIPHLELHLLAHPHPLAHRHGPVAGIDADQVAHQEGRRLLAAALEPALALRICKSAFSAPTHIAVANAIEASVALLGQHEFLPTLSVSLPPELHSVLLEIAGQPLPARNETELMVYAQGVLARGIAAILAREKTELLAALRREDPASEQHKQIGIQLQQLEAERRALGES
jgi:acetyltransferase